MLCLFSNKHVGIDTESASMWAVDLLSFFRPFPQGLRLHGMTQAEALRLQTVRQGDDLFFSWRTFSVEEGKHPQGRVLRNFANIGGKGEKFC